MPKPKRYENLWDSFYSASTLQDPIVSSSTTESQPLHLNGTLFHQQQLNQNLRQQQLVPFLQSTPRSTASIQIPPHPTPSIQTTIQMIPSVQAVSQQKSSKKPSGRESMRYWTVDTIDSQGAIKKLKVKKRDLFNLSHGERIVILFDDLDSPIGEGQGILAGFCGILAEDNSIFPIHFKKWPDLPAPRFCFRTTESNARQYVYNSMCKKWGTRRIKLYDKVYDPLKIRAEIMDKVPVGIPRDQWISYVDYRFKDETKKMCTRNSENRKKQTISHIAGPKSNSRRRAEMTTETGQTPGRGQLYLATHRNEDGSYVNKAAKEICVSFYVSSLKFTHLFCIKGRNQI